MAHEPTDTEDAEGGQNKKFGPALQVLEAAIVQRAFPCCAFGVLAGGGVALSGALGRFTYEDDASPVEPDTVFDLASVTKVVSTTAMAMLLHQRGQLDLEMPVGEVLPGFVVGRPTGDRARHVRLKHLLAHSSGLPGYVSFFKSAQSPARLIQSCLELPLEAEPGARAEYSDPGFILLGKALEVIAGEPLASWTHREIFVPLGMAATRYNPPKLARPQVPPTEEDAAFRRRVIQGEVQDENAFVLGGVAGHAGLFSNVPDLLRYAAEILSARPEPGETAPGNSIFDPATVETFAERQPPEGSSRALGWDTPSEISTSGHHFSKRSIGHLGFSGCSLWIDLEDHIAVVLLTNRTWPDRSNRLIREVWPAFHDAVREAL
ncbi:MAG TPA: serine hydrolase domain-containing protein [Terracidiphilus sp.]|nr:serine hydrolase domain-containing protein [Terracidiphilus sp.]